MNRGGEGERVGGGGGGVGGFRPPKDSKRSNKESSQNFIINRLRSTHTLRGTRNHFSTDDK